MPKRVVVLGAYGLIGAACVRELVGRGFAVTGVGRSTGAGRRAHPGMAWLTRDLATMTVEDFHRDLDGVDVVVNASGALQDGARDSLQQIHVDAVVTLVRALEGRATRLVQISAAGVAEDAGTAFLRTKAAGDRAIMESDVDWVILRPTLVIAPDAWGGTALLRASAAVPVVALRVFPDAPIQTVSVFDVAEAVARAAGDPGDGDRHGEAEAEGNGKRDGARAIAPRTLADLTEETVRPFSEVVEEIRAWQGFAPWRRRVDLPAGLLRLAGWCGDGLGWLGWRPPLRSTALSVLRDGITGDPNAWIAAGGQPCRGLAETLAAMPATVQERWFARLYLLLPAAIAVLAAFWFLTGVLTLARFDAARALLVGYGLTNGAAATVVAAGSLADIGLGLLVLVRRFARHACLAMAALSLGYLAGATVLAPQLWIDPLGPLLKVLPAILLALVAAALLEDR